jgi:hypothetical protein
MKSDIHPTGMNVPEHLSLFIRVNPDHPLNPCSIKNLPRCICCPYRGMLPVALWGQVNIAVEKGLRFLASRFIILVFYSILNIL